MGNFRNLDGTTKKSFKIGTNGVMMTSTAAVSPADKNTMIKYLVTNQKIPGIEDYYRIAYEDPNNTIYDTFIRSSEILSFSYGNEGGLDYIEFILRNANPNDPQSIRIYTSASANVSGPSQSTREAIVLFNDTTGKVLKDSTRLITDNINPLAENAYTDKSIPSVGAVNKLVGLVSEPLRRAIEGSGNYLLSEDDD